MEIYSILIIFIAISILISFAIGANDETFSTVYGSHTLRMKEILILTTIMAILGTLILGRGVSETVGNSILNLTVSNGIVLTILISTAIWLIISSIFSIPISTTHATIGAIIGIGLFLGGPGGVNWAKILEMSLWWILSPVIGFFTAYFVYWLLHKLVISKLSGLKNYEKAERIFSYILLGVICLTAFSRAGNDCSNAIGILVGIEDGIDINLALIITGISFSAGIIVLGRRVIKNVGTITELRPSTAFACEIPTTIILFAGTILGIPLSGSHMLVASIVGISKAQKTRLEGGMWKMIIIWLLTFPISAFLAFIIYLPINLFI
ncbi:MAG: inorganic phosphate transporter [Promethearchaeota archaeon]|nr:MAG: inorganic phosphate transporter [Candidatus Lokiarchaeota archaeon]